MTTKGKMTKQLFEKTLKKAMEWHDIKTEFDSAVENTWGYHYSDSDIDQIIDAIDYGHGGLSYKQFRELMGEEV